MIITKIIGGLGNQMFQYAAGLRLAKEHKTELKLDINGYNLQNELKISHRIFKLDELNISSSLANDAELAPYYRYSDNKFRMGYNKILARYMPGKQRTYILQRKFNFHMSFLDLPDNVYLDGYWQSEKYFNDISNVIRNEFTLKVPNIDKYSYLLESIRNSESVAVHVRRGDYVSSSRVNQHYEPCPMEYYKSSVQSILAKVRKPRFFLFSDDVEWTEQNLRIYSNDVIVSKYTNHDELIDLILMSNCKHQIIANSSFSWWAAWLNANRPKIVIAPGKWTKDEKKDKTNLIPEDWMTL